MEELGQTGTTTSKSQTKYYTTTLTLLSDKPTRTGYNFQGWGTSASATTVAYAAGGSYTGNANLALYAVWSKIKYTISFNANGGNGAPSSVEKEYGESITLPSTKPTRTGYTFKGWSTSSTATSATYSAGGSYTANASVTLYAVWSNNVYTITLNNQSATSAGSTAVYLKYATGIYKESGCTTQMTTSANAITVPTRNGYTFGGYYTGTSGSGTQLINASGYITSSFTTTKYSAATTIYAKWTANVYTITLNNQSATSAGSTAVYLKYATGVYKESGCTTLMTTSANPITKPTRTGYTFGGYYTSTGGSGTQLINASGYITSSFTTTYCTAAKTIYAKWTAISYTITFNHYVQATDGSSYSLSTTTTTSANYNSTITMSGYKTSISGAYYRYASLTASTSGGTAATSFTVTGAKTVGLYYVTVKSVTVSVENAGYTGLSTYDWMRNGGTTTATATVVMSDGGTVPSDIVTWSSKNGYLSFSPSTSDSGETVTITADAWGTEYVYATAGSQSASNYVRIANFYWMRYNNTCYMLSSDETSWSTCCMCSTYGSQYMIIYTYYGNYLEVCKTCTREYYATQHIHYGTDYNSTDGPPSSHKYWYVNQPTGSTYYF